MKKSILYTLLFVSILQSCGTSSNVTSNFSIQKRKYTKGWNVKELFHGKQHKENSEAEIQSNAFKSEEKDQESTSIKSNPEEKFTAETTTIEVAEVKLNETNNEIQLAEKFDAIENDNRLATSPKIEEAQTAASSEKHVDLKEEQNEKKIDYLFRIFFIIGFALAILASILAPIPFTAEFAISLLVLLFLSDIASLVFVTILLVKRHKNKGLYKESSLFVILTELLFGIVSLLSLLIFNAYSAF